MIQEEQDGMGVVSAAEVYGNGLVCTRLSITGVWSGHGPQSVPDPDPPSAFRFPLSRPPCSRL